MDRAGEEAPTGRAGGAGHALTPQPRAARLLGNAASVASNVTWAMTFPLTAALLAGWHPLLLGSARLGFAALALWPFVLLFRRDALARVPWLATAGLAMRMAGGVALLCWAQTMVDPTNAAVIVVTTPLVSAVLGWLEGRERLTLRLGIALLFAIAGGTIAALGAGPGLPGAIPGLGELIVLGSIVLWISFGRGVVNRLTDLDDLTRSAVPALFGSLWLALLGAVLLAFGAIEWRVDFGPTALLQLILLGAIGVGLATMLWFVSARHLGVTVTAMHQNIVPFYVMLMGVAMGDPLRVWPAVGAVLVVVGALVAQIGQRR